jgi:hypothetical protein
MAFRDGRKIAKYTLMQLHTGLRWGEEDAV